MEDGRLRIEWGSSDPAGALAALTRALGIAPGPDATFALANATLAVVAARGGPPLRVEAGDGADDDGGGPRRGRSPGSGGDPGSAGDPGGGAPLVVGIGWATVELERAAEDVAAAIAAGDWGGGVAAAGLAPGLRDPHLGARSFVATPAADRDDPILVLLEPDTEGRIAASLARFGEGPAVLYVAPAGDPRGAERAGGGVAGRDGPLGAARIAPTPDASGPHLLIVVGRVPSGA